ncbi:MAG TPA: AraC family transcriptional regulator ligand-binding domain-containing protein [Fontimonas sp.]
MGSADSMTTLRKPAGRTAPAAAKRTTTPQGQVRSASLDRFREIVSALGGDSAALLRQAGIEPALLTDDKASVGFAAVAQLLDHAADQLECSDLGMRLAAAQAAAGATRILGPIGVALRNAPTLRAALQYFADHCQAYNGAMRLYLDALPGDGRTFLLVEHTASAAGAQLQAGEHALALLHHVCIAIGNGRLRASEIWFSHEASAPPAVYRSQFSVPVRFSQTMSGLLFDEKDLDQPLPERDAQLFEIATSYIDQRFPALSRSLASRVRILITHLLAEGSCTHERVAAGLNLHPRTLQRRLRDEGESFEAIRDQVRRDVALRHLAQSNVSLVRMTEILGYSETSVLSRSCTRWFAASPRQLRKGHSGLAAASVGEAVG